MQNNLKEAIVNIEHTQLLNEINERILFSLKLKTDYRDR